MIRLIVPVVCCLILLAASAPLPVRFVTPVLDDSSRLQLLKAARQLLTETNSDDEVVRASRPQIALLDSKTAGTRVIVISLSREKATALVGVGMSKTLEQSVQDAAFAVHKHATAEEINAGRIKLDVAVERGSELKFDRSGNARLDPSLQGLWLPSAGLLLLPEELSSRGMMSEHGTLHRDVLATYLSEARKITLENNPGKSGSPYSTVKFDSFTEGAGGGLIKLYRGNATPTAEPAALLRVCVQGGDYLVRHQHEEGLFDYLYEPQNNEIIADYNDVRHAGTAYSLMELYGATKDPRYRAAGERAIDVMLRWVRTIEGKDLETLVYAQGKAKLGGTALAVVAILKHFEVTGDNKWLDHAKKFGRFLVFQQQKNGRFESNYFFGKANEEPFESLYYPGEAILALTRLHAVDPDNPEWQQAAARGVDWLVNVRDANKETSELPHDHWLLIALNELYPVTRNKKHLAHAERIVTAMLAAQRTSADPPDWIGSFYASPRTTPAATRAEAMVAMWQLAGKTGMKRDVYLESLKKIALFQMRAQITPENSLYLPRPDKALGGFRRSLQDFEIRIDYVQHDISSLLGLRIILNAPQSPS